MTTAQLRFLNPIHDNCTAETSTTRIFAGSDGPAVHGVYQNISNFSGGDLAVDYAYAKPGPRKFVGYGCDQANQPSYCSGFYANAVAVMSQRSTNQTEAGLPVSDWLLVLCPTFFDLPDQPALPDPAKPDGPVLDRSSCMLRELAELQDVEHSSPFPFLDESMKPLNPDSALAEKDYLLHNAVDPRVVADPNGCETYACVTTLAALSKNQTLLPGGEQYQPSGISVADYAKDIGVMAQYNSGSYAVFALLAHAQSKGES